MKTPVAFFVFNRPAWTARVFEEIRKARPRRLLIVADGPRREHPGDVEQCEKVRAILEQVDWECEVKRNFAGENLGCGKRVSSGLEWVFSEEEEVIILEDDCVPDQTFSRFARSCWSDIEGTSGSDSLEGSISSPGRERERRATIFPGATTSGGGPHGDGHGAGMTMT